MPVFGSIIKGAIELRSKVPTRITRFNPYKAQQHVLKKLIRKAQFTAFGEEFEFSEILKDKNFIQHFQQTVPIYDYESIFAQWWYRAINGESHVCWPNKINYFALSSGTSDASSKYIPVTSEMLRAIQKTSIRQIVSLAQYDFPTEFFEKGMLMLGGSTHLQYNGTYYEGDLSGITAGNIPFWFQHYYKPGKRISKERNWQTKLDEIVKRAPEWDIGIIVGVPAWLQILLEKIIETYNLKNIHDIWPNLSIFVHGGVAFTPYLKGFEKLLAHPILYLETYLASEGFIAFQNHNKNNSMQLVLNNGLFYEFVPFTSQNFTDEGKIIQGAKALTINEVEENKDYALLLSTCSGAWRYLIGDTIRFTSKENSEIIITGRTKQFLSICGEHLSVDNLTRAVHMLEQEYNIEIREFAVTGIKEGSLFAHYWYFGIDGAFDHLLAAKKIDEYLKILNDDYRVERLEAIRNVYAEVLPMHYFYDWLREAGKEGGQNKFPRVLKNEKFKSWECFLNSKISDRNTSNL